MREFCSWMRAELDRGETIWYEDRMAVMGSFCDLLAALKSEDLAMFKTLLTEIGKTYDRWQAMDFGFKESSRFFDSFQAAWSWVHMAAEEMLEIEAVLGRGELFEKYYAVTRSEITRSFSAFIPEKEDDQEEEVNPDLAWKLTDEQWEKIDPLGLTLQNLAYGWYKMGPGKNGRRVKALARGLVQLKEIIQFDQALADYTVNKLNGQGQSVSNLMLASLNLEAALQFYENGNQEKLVWYHLNRMGAIVSRVGGAEKWKREMIANGEDLLIDV